MRWGRAAGMLVVICGLLGSLAEAEVSITVSPTSLALTIISVRQAGALPGDAVDDATEIAYTVNDGTYKVTVNWANGDAAPRGTALEISALTVPAGCGTAATLPITLTSAPQDLITGIVNATPDEDPVRVTYRLRVVNLAELVAEQSTVTLTYTITGI